MTTTQNHASPTNKGAHTRQNPLLLLLLIAALLGAGVIWLRQQQAPATSPENLPPELRDEPDLFVNNAIIHQFNADGTRKYLLKAETINHFENETLTRMRQPDLILEGRDEPWRATAETGYVRNQTINAGEPEEVVFLRENVELSQTLEPPRYLSMSTMALYLFPDREFVETDESVTIDTHTGRTTASAMSGNLETGVLYFSGDKTGDTQQVKTIVLPSQFK